jgi:hypothetical protein
MNEAHRLAYLDAMGLDAWVLRPPETAHDRLVLQPGEGGTLLICELPDATATRIAGDISRALAGQVVWAWPDPQGSPDCPLLEEAVSQQLFTRVVLFGTELEGKLFKGKAPLTIGSAGITVTVSLEELAVRGSAKRELWNRLSGMAGL